LCLKSGCPVL